MLGGYADLKPLRSWWLRMAKSTIITLLSCEWGLLMRSGVNRVDGHYEHAVEEALIEAGGKTW